MTTTTNDLDATGQAAGSVKDTIISNLQATVEVIKEIAKEFSALKTDKEMWKSIETATSVAGDIQPGLEELTGISKTLTEGFTVIL